MLTILPETGLAVTSRAMATAAHRVTQDLLQLGFVQFPADMLAIFKRDGYAEGSVLTRPETAPDARDILYHNWAFIRSTPAAGTTRWPVFINPLGVRCGGVGKDARPNLRKWRPCGAGQRTTRLARWV